MGCRSEEPRFVAALFVYQKFRSVNKMNIKLNRNSETPIYLQIKSAIIKLITSQELVSGYKLPSERKLADELGVHRNTVVKAYGELTCEGYLDVSRKAPKGYFVAASQD